MQLSTEYTADNHTLGIDIASLPDMRKRASHLSHFLHAYIPYNEMGFQLIREGDLEILVDPTEGSDTGIMDSIEENQEEPAPFYAYANDIILDIAAIAHIAADFTPVALSEALKIDQKDKTEEQSISDNHSRISATQESLGDSESKGTFAQAERIEPATMDMATQLEPVKSLDIIREFSSYSTDKTELSMERSGFLKWLREKRITADQESESISQVSQSSEDIEEIIHTEDVNFPEADSIMENVESPSSADLSEEENSVAEEHVDEDTPIVESKEKLQAIVNESIEMGDELISETLADLLGAHGHKNRAEKMYQQLGLLFPEKSTYFAQKIEELNKR